MAEPDAVEKQPVPDPNEKLVKVFDAEEETEVLLVKGLLEAAGIECDMTPRSLSQYAFPNVGGTILQVREEDAAEALRLIEEQRRAEPGPDDETAEFEAIQDEPEKP